jgi:hypothetical protein
MAFTLNSTVDDIVRKPGGKAVIDKYYGSVVDQSTLSMALVMSVQAVAGYVGWNRQKVEEFLKELNTLP